MDKYNTLWRRFAAAIIDGIILWPLTSIDNYLEESATRLTFSIWSLFFATICSAYFIILHAKYGQTAGKKIMRIKAVDINEISPIGIKRSIIRELPLLIAFISVFFYLAITLFLTNHLKLEKAKDTYNNLISTASFTWMLIELITTLTNYKRRAVHDYLAKSVVIKTDR